jgi:hypothetical protein
LALLVAVAACESAGRKAARLRKEAEYACQQASDTKHRFDSTFGKWMSQYPDTLLQVAAAYGDTIEERQNKCDAANRKYEDARARGR